MLNSYGNFIFFLAELQRAKRVSEAPWVRKIGNPSSRENLVMTSAYDRASERASERPYRLGGRGRGAERERERQRARINRQRCGEEVRERAGHG